MAKSYDTCEPKLGHMHSWVSVRVVQGSSRVAQCLERMLRNLLQIQPLVSLICVVPIDECDTRRESCLQKLLQWPKKPLIEVPEPPSTAF